MKETTRNLIVGITAAVGLIALGWLVFMFGDLPAWGAEGYRIQVRLDSAGGLTAESRVQLNGIDVGQVQSVRLMENAAQGVIFSCVIEEGYRIPANSRVTTSSGLLGGTASLSIRPQPVDGEQVQYLPTDGSGQLEGRVSSLTRELQQVADSLSGDIQMQLQNFGRVSEKIVELSDQYIQVGQQLSEMLEQRSPQQVDAGETQANLTTVIARADARLADLSSTMDSLTELLGDPQLHEDIRQTAANARQMTANATQLTEDASQQIDRLTGRYMAVADELGQTLDQATQLMQQARTGEGTLGRLIEDPALYNSITDAANRLDDALQELQLLIQKWKAEGVPVQF